MPSALRPAVEIIARLSAERNRLRDEVARLREELRSAPRPGDLVRLQAERDALVRDVAELRAKERRSSLASGGLARQELTRHDDSADAALRRLFEGQSGGANPLAGLVGRLERAVARLEGRSPGANAPEVQGSAPEASATEQRFGSGSARRERTAEQGSTRGEAPAPRGSGGGLGGGFLGGLVQANLALRGGSTAPAEAESKTSSGGRARSSAAARRWSEPAPATDERGSDESGRAPARTRHKAAPPTGLGGGFLAGLVDQNLALRSGA